ncbi:MAG: hypothetical protein JNM27_05740 [Leptospirales bacterium]|nr:hypothetical protein [Leptospirales bacterium]
MKILASILLLALAASLAISCRREEPYDYDESTYPFWVMMLTTYSYRSSSGDTILIQDRLDGSVEMTRRRSYGGLVYRVLVQKCPLGYTFSTQTKLCTKGDTVTFQYCSVASNACNASNGTLTNLGTSEAYQGCNSNNLLALTWQVISENVLIDMMHHPDRDSVFPDLMNNYYWANNTSNTTTANVYRRTDLKEARSKTERHGVVCQFSGEFY